MKPKDRRKKILMLTDGNIDNASARIRAIGYIPYLESSGYSITWIPRIAIRKSASFHKWIIFPIMKRWYELKRKITIKLFRYDIVFIQRILLSPNELETLKLSNTPYIFDFDDAIYLNPARKEDYERVSDMVREAWRVIVSTVHLRPFCLSNGNDPWMIPSPVETNRLIPTEKRNKKLVIGWIGSQWTTKYLSVVEEALDLLAQKHSFRFIGVGMGNEFHPKNLEYESRPWIFEQENDQLASFDIGIMPLPDDEYAKMKGGYKLLQYMSAGIPCVASPVGINRMIIREGENGFLASSQQDWFDKLEQLLLNEPLRLRLGSQGRKDALDRYSREICFEQLKKVLE